MTQQCEYLEVPVGGDSGIAFHFINGKVKIRANPRCAASSAALSQGDKILSFGDWKTPATNENLGELRAYLKDCERTKKPFKVSKTSKKTPQTKEQREEAQKKHHAERSRSASQDVEMRCESARRKSNERRNQSLEKKRDAREKNTTARSQSRSRLSDVAKETERDKDTTARSQSRTRLTREERDQQRLLDAKAHKDKRASMTSEERQAYFAEQQKYDKAYYDSLKATEEGRIKLAKKKSALRERRAGWTEVEKDVERALNLVGKIRRKRTESELQWEMRIVEEVEREADIEAEKRELEYELCKESVDLKKNTAALASRIRMGIPISDAAKLKALDKEKKAAAKRGRELKKDAKGQTPIGLETDEDKRKEVEESLKDLFEHLLKESSLTPCISCRTLKTTTQPFKIKSLDKIGQEMEKLKVKAAVPGKKGEFPLKQLRKLEKALEDLTSTFAKRKREEAAKLGVSLASLERFEARVCSTCWQSLRTGKAPALGNWNNLEPIPVPSELKKLGELGQVLLALRIPLMKILGLPVGGQKAVRGGAIHVVNSVEQTIGSIFQALPNTFSGAEIVGCDLKRMLDHKTVTASMLISPDDLVKALNWLKLNNRFYRAVNCLDAEAWKRTAKKDNKDLFSALIRDEEELEAAWAAEEGAEEPANANPLPDTLALHVDGPQINLDSIEGHFKELARSRANPHKDGEKSDGAGEDDPSGDSAEEGSGAALLEPMGSMSISESSPEKSPLKKIRRKMPRYDQGQEKKSLKAKKLESAASFRRERKAIEEEKEAMDTSDGTQDSDSDSDTHASPQEKLAKLVMKKKVQRKKESILAKQKSQVAKSRAAKDGVDVTVAEAGKAGGRRYHRTKVQIAPGEGQKPIPLWMEDDGEPLSYPRNYPTGENHLNSQRDEKVSSSAFFKNRLMHEDSRFRCDLSYVFFSFYKLEFERLISSVNISLCKGLAQDTLGDRITAHKLRDPSTLSNFIAKDNAYRFLQRSRGSPAYWKNSMLDLLGMVRMLGAPTWFLTLSADDKHWPEVMRPCFEAEFFRTPSDEELEQLPTMQRNKLLRRHPAIAAHHFHRRTETLFNKILKDPRKPLGDVVDVYRRYEWQQRGSPHVHSMLWVKGAPKLGIDSPEDIAAWIDTYISGVLPDKDEDPDLHDLVSRLQVHAHRDKCQKKDVKVKISKEDRQSLTPQELEAKEKDARCRYGFAKPLVEHTHLFIPPRIQQELDDVEMASNVAKEQKLEEMRKEGRRALDVEAEARRLDEELEADKHKVLQCSNVEVRLRRDEPDTSVNNYNSTILRMWRANTDIQFITNAYACIMYLVGYVAKAERQLAEDVKKAEASVPPGTSSKKKMRVIANAFIRCRLISAQEAIHNVLGLPYVKKSRQVIFLPNGFPKARFRMMKSWSEREKLPADSEDVFQDGVIQKYETRSTKGCSSETKEAIERMPLAVFASCYDQEARRKGKEESDEEDEETMADLPPPPCLPANDEEAQEEEMDRSFAEPPQPDEVKAQPDGSGECGQVPQHMPARILLESGRVMLRRRRQKIVRTRRLDPDKEAEEYAYSTLLFYLPFVGKEENFLSLDNVPYKCFEEWMLDKQEEIEDTSQHYEAFGHIVSEAFQRMADNKAAQQLMQDIEDRNAGDGDSDGDEDDDMGHLGLIDPGDVHVDAFEHVDGAGGDYEPDQPQRKRELLAATIDDLRKKTRDMEQMFNPGQLAAYTTVQEAMVDMKEHEDDGRQFPGKAFFLSGPGGVGKSFSIEGITCRAHEIFFTRMEDLTSLVTATTGTAATLIDGITLHTALKFPPTMNHHTPQSSMSAQVKERLRNAYKDVRVVVIDEVSMLGQHHFDLTNERLNTLFAERNPGAIFGGKIIIFAGDLFQLAPVNALSVFDARGGGALGTHLWKDNVKLLELSELMRTRGDESAFPEALLRIRVGERSEGDMDLINSRLIDNLPGLALDSDEILDLPHAFPVKKLRDAHNKNMRERLWAKKKAELRAIAVATGQNPDEKEKEAQISFVSRTTVEDPKLASFLKRDPVHYSPADPDKCGGIPVELDLVKDMRVMLTANMNVSDRLANGSTGILRGWIGPKGGANQAPPSHLIIEFDDDGHRMAGKATRDAFLKEHPELAGVVKQWKDNYIPIPPFSTSYPAELAGSKVKLRNMRLRRRGFPLIVAFATTIHKLQGATRQKLVVDLSRTFGYGMVYTALSRVTSLQGLYLRCPLVPERISVNPRCLQEMNRLREFSQLPVQPIPPELEERAAKAAHKADRQYKSKAKVKASVGALMGAGEKEMEVAVEETSGLGALLARHLPQELHDVAMWLISGFTAPARKNRESQPSPEGSPALGAFHRHGIHRLKQLSQHRRQDFAALLRFLRHSEEMRPKRFQQKEATSTTGSLYPQMAQVLKAVTTTGNGNCLWNSISISLTGTEHLHRLLRGVSTYVMVSWPELFLAMAQSHGRDETSYEKEVFVSFALKEWGDTDQQVALSIALGRDLFLHNPVRHKELERGREGRTRWTGRWVYERGLSNLDEVDLEELCRAYREGVRGLGYHFHVPGASVLLNEAGLGREEVLAFREPLLTHFERDHYTALLPLPDVDLRLAPRPFQANYAYTDLRTRGSIIPAPFKLHLQ